MLIILIYCSQVYFDCLFVDFDVLVYCVSSKNLFFGIIGILLFNGLQFFQVLEGIEEVFELLFSEI